MNYEFYTFQWLLESWAYKIQRKQKTVNNLALLELTGPTTMYSTRQYRTVCDACESLSSINILSKLYNKDMLGSIIWWVTSHLLENRSNCRENLQYITASLMIETFPQFECHCSATQVFGTNRRFTTATLIRTTCISGNVHNLSIPVNRYHISYQNQGKEHEHKTNISLSI